MLVIRAFVGGPELKKNNTQHDFTTKDTRSSLHGPLKKIKPNCMLSHTFSTIFSYYYCKSWKYVCVMKGMFWTDEKLSLIVAWSSSFPFPAPKFRIQVVIWFGF